MNSQQTHPRFSPIQAAAALLLALALSGTTVRAQLLEYDGFNYTGTSLDTQSGGTGWGANAWQDTDFDTPLSNDGISLTFPPSVTHTAVGGRIVFPAAGEAERRLGTTMSLAPEGGTYYFSALVNRQGDFRFEFIDNGTNVRWVFGAAGDNSTNTGLAGVSAPVYANGIFPVGETVYVVAKLVTRAAAAPGDEFYLNVYRAGDIVPGTEPGAWQVSGAQNSGVVLTRFQIRNVSELPLAVDEIRIGTNYAEVVGGLVSGPPIVTRQPAPVTVYAGANVRFSVDASGQLPLHFQWRHGGNPLPNETNSMLNLANVQPLQAGAYSVTVTNAIGSTNSDPAALNVIAITDTTVGLQALWHFDETTGLLAFDATANDNDGTLFNYVGDDSQWIPSDFNGALDFNRSLSQYVDVPHSASIGANLANRFSVTAWIRSRVDLLANGSTYRVLEKENTFFLLQGTGASGGMNLLVKKNTANITAGIGETLLANRWYHLAGTYDGTTLRMYLDGVLKTNVPVAAPIDTTTLPLRIGSDYMPTGPGSRFDGAIDEVGIWERPLTEAEILQLAGQTGLPNLLEQPQSQTRYVGGSVILTVRARGQQPLRYLWYHGTEEIRTATTSTLTLANLQPGDAGNYYCKVSNDLGDTPSATAVVTVTPVSGIADGLELQYKFDETTGLTAADTSGLAREGQLMDFPDATSHWISGQVNGALSFNGENDLVAANSSTLNLGSDATFAFWIRPTTYGTFHDAATYIRQQGRILRKAGLVDLEIVDDPGSVRATLRANGVPATQNSVQLNQWQHFAVVFQAGTVSFYKNGFRLGDPAPATLGAANTNVMVLGNLDDNLVSSNYFAGGMDEVGIWARPLNESEILSLAGRDVVGPPVIVTQPQPVTRYVGGSAGFLVEATGKRPVTYAWQRGGTPLPNSNTNRLVLTNLTVAAAGGYTVTVQNDLNSANSTPPALLTVLQITNVATGLVAYWTFDETSGTVFNDASGRGHHATLQNGTIVPGTLGIVGGAYDFDGADDFAIVPHAAELNLADQASVSVWVNPRSLGVVGGLGRIVRKDINVDLTLVTANSTFQVYGGLNKSTYIAPANSATTNQWQHIAVVTRDGMLEFFRNGRSLGPPFPGFFGPENLNDLIIANFGPDLSINRVFNGYMDELGLWNRALSASEVDGIYQNGLVAQGLNAPFVPFAIEEINFPSASQVRLVFFSPYTDRNHAIQRKDDLGAASWTDTPATLTALGGGHVQALFDKPVGNAFFRVVALPKPLLFADDFETGGPGWTHGGSGDNWELGTPVNGPGAAFNGTNVYATSLTGNIQPFSDTYLRSPTINLTGVTRATLAFQEWRNVDPNPTFHGTIVNVLDANTQGLITQLSVQAGATAGWQPRTLQLPPLALGKNIILEFRLYCDNFNLLEGWYIDDVKLSPE